MDESQQYGNYHGIALLAAIQQPALIVFVGDHRQTPGRLSKGRAAAANRKKLLQRPLGLRALNQVGDYLPPARLSDIIARLWPDACQDDNSDIAQVGRVGRDPHTGTWVGQYLPSALERFWTELSGISMVTSNLVATALTVMLIATAPEEFGIPECTHTVEAAGLKGPHRWDVILPNSSRVSLLTYKSIVAVRYPELVTHGHGPLQIGHFVVLLEHLKYQHQDIRQGTTSQLLVLCNRTAVHNQLLQHGFQTSWRGGLRVSTSSCCWCHGPHCCHCPNRVWLP